MYNYLWRIRFDSWRTEFGAEDMRKISAYSQRRDGRVEGSPSKFERASDHCDSTEIGRESSLLQRGKGLPHSSQQYSCSAAVHMIQSN